MLKQSISDPYNFHHLTHTGSVQAKALQNVDQNELVTEFSAIRASQAPHRELKGIKAETLHSRNDSYPSSQVDSPTTSFDSSTTPSSLSPVKSRDRFSESPQSDAKNIRYSQSVDSFARISSRSFSSPTPPISPPPRRSSKTPLTLPNLQVVSAQQSSTASMFSSFGRHPYTASGPTSPLYPGLQNIVGVNTLDQSDICNVGHAITTPDDTAFDLRSPQSSIPSASLADVPEEDEGPTWLRNSINNARPSTANSAVRHVKSFPLTTSSMHRIERSPVNTFSSSTDPNARSDPTLPHSINQVEEIPHRRTSRRVSAGQILIRDSWEDDIDYCYEHAAEADCAFDWDRVSIEDDRASSATEVIDDIITNITSSYEHIPDEIATDSSTTNESNPSLIQPSRPTSYACAFLDYGRLIQSEMDALSQYSLTSSAINLPGAVTPSDSIISPQIINQSARTSQGSMLFNLSSDAFEESFVRDDATKIARHPMYSHQTEAGLRREDSLRSNDSPPSTCNSQESMLPTRANSINPRHGPSSSISSLPELIYSKNTHENTDVPVYQLTEHINHLDVSSGSGDCNNHLLTLGKTTSTASIVQEDQHKVFPTSSISPLQYRRDRSQSDFTESASNEPSIDPISTASNARKRSASGPTAVPVITSSRTSYSLFPTVPVR